MINYVHTLFFLIITLVIVCLTTTRTEESKHCSLLNLFNKCKENETCSQVDNSKALGICKCKSGFKNVGDGCLNLSSTVAPIHTVFNTTTSIVPADLEIGLGEISTLWLVIPLCALITIGLCIFASKRYMWMDRLYQMRVRHYNNVLVRSQGDDDDSPIA